MRKAGTREGGIRFRQTLLSRYLLIILFAFMFIPVIFPLTSIGYMVMQKNANPQSDYLKYGNAASLEAMWHKEASLLSEAQPERIDGRLRELKQAYPEASVFWVDASGATRLQMPEQDRLPAQWTQADAIRFMKASVGGDPYTVVAFIGQASGAETGFMVMQMPRSVIEIQNPIGVDTPYYIAFIFVMFVFFIALSLLFFRHIRRRLLRLQAAMAVHGDDGLPMPVVQTKPDEIGQLEQSFNRMVEQLKAGKERERAEEELRKRLIANLSHDLRTPLTVMNSHVYSLRKEALSEAGQAAVKQIEQKIAGTGSLIDNLLSYTLMTSGRYPLKLERQDMLRLIRESAADWYPLWEQEGIEADIGLPDESVYWRIDKEGFRRVLDNLFQNVVRHAKGGRYIGISVEAHGDRQILSVCDRGAGMNADSGGKGAGIGLAIVGYLLSEMGLAWHTESADSGTKVLIYPK
ncbi:HAMP domain-containing sensor histidine kinase [Paenibacillus vietnamensis]|uniref:HAMP domain-containing sensor histidine kinase n=1 Tax=Paenibacillus vietnamensis TaxID=2590547 RepID=UPI001CD0C8D2|nr:HAMP domain-containing sensor histidine kinase [Paenibacillus vietnamensis]